MGIFDFGALKSASAALEDQRTKLEAELARINAGLEALRREREDLIETPVLNSDLADGLCGLVDAQAAEYADELRTSLEPFRRSPAAVAHQATPGTGTNDRPHAEPAELVGQFVTARAGVPVGYQRHVCVNGKVWNGLVSRLPAGPECVWLFLQTLQEDLRIESASVETAVNDESFLLCL